jgi:hypothetical protein
VIPLNSILINILLQPQYKDAIKNKKEHMEIMKRGLRSLQFDVPKDLVSSQAEEPSIVGDGIHIHSFITTTRCIGRGRESGGGTGIVPLLVVGRACSNAPYRYSVVDVALHLTAVTIQRGSWKR